MQLIRINSNISNNLFLVIITIFVLQITACGSSENITENEPVTSEVTEESSTPADSSDLSSQIQDSEKIRRDSLIQVYKEEIYNENQTKANRITTFYMLAQEKFYSGEYEEALFLINRALRVKESADVLALKGSIYLGLGSIENFVEFWRQALEMDENLPIPPSPAIVEELKRQGLIQ